MVMAMGIVIVAWVGGWRRWRWGGDGVVEAGVGDGDGGDGDHSCHHGVILLEDGDGDGNYINNV